MENKESLLACLSWISIKCKSGCSSPLYPSNTFNFCVRKYNLFIKQEQVGRAFLNFALERVMVNLPSA